MPAGGREGEKEGHLIKDTFVAHLLLLSVAE